MPEEERARLKEQYIKELRERKQIRRTIESAKKTQAINNALGAMADTLASAGDTADEFTARLDAETALNEARLEVALEDELSKEKTSAADLDSAPQTSDPPSKTIGPRLKADTPDKDV
ncbi:MAG: hypothetical protein OXI05_08555 [Bacteroidota bacterium]|nr:hypothetical protein [Bacteroidota bacterium]MXW15429.1 hypothetical protein [Rhodothermaceae bacterium]MDE2645874.1 hypothetical protein [Bacteroidota bacterium]MXW31972.1 hypothetical protein [Rhodothermaceae bacterium]MXZ16668.1 hypothetical protein [Rhodothermaceae bacterium]